jgi:hypothetical protein
LTAVGAVNSMSTIEKFDGFQRCLPWNRRTYFDMIARTALDE